MRQATFTELRLMAAQRTWAQSTSWILRAPRRFFPNLGAENPAAGVLRDRAGNLYGTTTAGGKGAGILYKLDATGHLTVLHNFTWADGAAPYAGVIADSSGNLYGTTYSGGTYNAGVLYELDAAGNYKVLLNFSRTGSNPYAGVIRDPAGNLYGTTYWGGSQGGYAGYGVVYKLDTAGNETVLYNFMGGLDGANPYGGLVLDPAGNLYGTTFTGGATGFTGCYYGCGTIYKVDPSGQETVLYRFEGYGDGELPYAGLIRDSEGNLYGTTGAGGMAYGVVYKLDTTGHETVLHSFTGGSDGAEPYSGVIRDPAGNLYGTTYLGGSQGGYGVVYKLDTAGNETVLYNFMGGLDGANPYGGLVLDSAGNLYGTTEHGGKTNSGVVFELKPAAMAP
jgi:uncharacterized repeat protein (TIGR03803 family)